MYYVTPGGREGVDFLSLLVTFISRERLMTVNRSCQKFCSPGTKYSLILLNLIVGVEICKMN